MGENLPISMSCQLLPLSAERNRPMRQASTTASGSAGLMVMACPSSMPSAKLSLTILLLRCGSSESRIRSALQSLQVSPPSVVRITPLISRAA